MLSLPLVLVARLLPVAVLATAGWGLTAGSEPEANTPTSAASRPSVKAATAPTYAKPPTPCTAVGTGTVEELVPGARTAGTELEVSDTDRRTGCSWNALQGYEYRWLDVSFEVSPEAGETEAAHAFYTARKRGTAVSGLGDEASADTETTEEDGQETRGAVVVVRQANAVVTVTYNGSDFETRKGAPAADMRDGALKVAKEALTALGDKSS
ncbi:hypothetical protein [Streptomyces sp. 8N706]|uniref:hypothetical protein n=1 Tax=Streptomyces sp. 8N706 TaxID=3457416 RepID=UPI003FD49795